MNIILLPEIRLSLISVLSFPRLLLRLSSGATDQAL